MGDQKTTTTASGPNDPASTVKHAPPETVEGSPSTLPPNPPETGPYKGLTPSEQAEKERVEAEARNKKAADERAEQQEKDAKTAQQAHDDAVEAQEKRAKEANR